MASTVTQQATVATPAKALMTGQIGVLIAIGVALWFGAALLLRAIGPLGVYEGLGPFALYAAIIPLTVPFVPLTRWLAGLRADQIGTGVTIVTASAALCDGLAIALTPTLYGNDPALVTGAAAAILWGVGVGLVLGLVMNKPARD